MQTIHAVIRKALQDAYKRDDVPVNVATKATPPTRRSHGDGQAGAPELHYWTAEQVRAFVDALAAERLRAAYVLAVNTGMRRGEVLGLSWDDVDLAGSTPSCPPITRDGERPHAADNAEDGQAAQLPARRGGVPAAGPRQRWHHLGHTTPTCSQTTTSTQPRYSRFTSTTQPHDLLSEHTFERGGDQARADPEPRGRR